jgi:hypothetical protein
VTIIIIKRGRQSQISQNEQSRPAKKKKEKKEKNLDLELIATREKKKANERGEVDASGSRSCRSYEIYLYD